MLCTVVDMGALESGIGDYNCDGLTELADFAFWDGCMYGPAVTVQDGACAVFDADADGDVDLADFAALSDG